MHTKTAHSCSFTVIWITFIHKMADVCMYTSMNDGTYKHVEDTVSNITHWPKGEDRNAGKHTCPMNTISPLVFFNFLSFFMKYQNFEVA